MTPGRLCACSLVLIGFVPLLAMAQPTTAPTTKEASSSVIANVEYNGASINDVLDELNKAGPPFQAVLGAGEGFPTVTLHLKNVTPEQVLRVIEKQLSLVVETAGNPPIYVVSGPRAMNEVVPPTQQTTAYRLTPVIDQLLSSRGDHAAQANVPATQESGGKTRKAAMNDVVAVLQTALNVTQNAGALPVIEVHEPTEMLIIRASPEQRDAIESVLRALEPWQGMVVKGEKRPPHDTGGGGGGGGQGR